MAQISIKNLSFEYNSNAKVFDKLQANIDTDWRLGLVGRNGKGKTTLLKLICGEYEYSGTIDITMSTKYFPYSVDESATVEALGEQFIDVGDRWKIEKELSLLGFADDISCRVFSTFSKGEQTKILLAMLFADTDAFLLIDEPTNHLDVEGRELLAKYMQKKRGFILVSHDRTFIDSCVDHIMSINKESIEICGGNYSTYLENKLMREENDRRENQRIEGEIDRLSVASKRTSEWSDKVEATKYGGKQSSGLKGDKGYIGAKAAKLMKRAKSIEGRINDSIEVKSKLLKDIERTDAIKIYYENFRTDRLIAVRELVISYDNKAINEPVSFEINRGDRIAICGKNGSGKTSVLKAILNELSGYFSGEIIAASGIVISCCPQDVGNIKGTFQDFCLEWNVDKTLLTTILYKLGFEKEQFDKRLESYSLGQKKKIMLAKSFCERANLYIWDEPLNYIDIVSRRQIEDAILTYKPTMIFIEHDKFFVDSVATKKVIL